MTTTIHPQWATKIPATRPQWAHGNYALFADNMLVGYFRQFKSAHLWREYLAATTTASTLYVTHRGQTVNIWHR